jgi:hypothetical protein
MNDPLLDPQDGASPVDRLVGVIARFQAPAGLLLVVGGFVAVFLGWLEASGTADVRIQMQDLISGGIGGLGMLVVGGVLLQSSLADRAARRTEAALLQLGEAIVRGGGTAGHVSLRPLASTTVLATHASYHLPGCDLLEERAADEIRETTHAKARRAGLVACRICLPEKVASA